MLRVGGEPKETEAPTLRGAARSRILQEGPSVCCGLAVSPGNRGHVSGRTKSVLWVGGEPRKTEGPSL